jgi:AGCS family alanine or glycine:cation symporter
MLLQLFNHALTLWVVFPAIIGLGLYLTIHFKFTQIRELRNAVTHLFKKNENEAGNISRFGALSSVLAGNFGTGNISGMAIAIATGGPGSLVWMWIMAFFGAIIQYASCILGVLYRKENAKKEYVGGPMYYLRDGLGFHNLAKLFAICTIFGAFAVGNLAQINSMTLPFINFGIKPLHVSIVIGLFVGIVMLGGIKRLSQFASFIVPFKALLYLGTGFTIIFLYRDAFIPAVKLMFEEAFHFSSFTGGVLGISVFKAIQTGFDRGLFATDAGTGIVPILQAGARSKNPLHDGVATLLSPLMVMVVCTTTGLVLIMTGAYQTDLQSTNMVTHAFAKGLNSPIGGYIVLLALMLFAYTTILAWGHCGAKATEFLFGARFEKYFQGIFILLIPLGAVLKISLIWTLADVAISLMLILNLIGIIGLLGKVKETHFSSA